MGPCDGKRLGSHLVLRALQSAPCSGPVRKRRPVCPRSSLQMQIGTETGPLIPISLKLPSLLSPTIKKVNPLRLLI